MARGIKDNISYYCLMEVSENFRSVTAGALLIYITIGIYYSYSVVDEQWVFVDGSVTNQLLVEGGISIITMLLMAFYFYKKQWYFVLVCFLLMDIFNISLLVFDLTEPLFLDNTPNLYFFLGSLSFLFISPLFSVSLLTTTAGNYKWLKAFAISSLALTAITFVSNRFSMPIPNWFHIYLPSLINIFLILYSF